MALQTREQHIRREKATSNVCTAQVLLANMAGLYAVYHGPEGLKRHRARVHARAKLSRSACGASGWCPRRLLRHAPVTAGTATTRRTSWRRPAELPASTSAFDRGSFGDGARRDHLADDVNDLLAASTGTSAPASTVMRGAPRGRPRVRRARCARTTDFLTHPTFHRYHSETEMLRYLRSARVADLSLTHSHDPAGQLHDEAQRGSAEMIPVTLAGFSGLHPFAPVEQARATSG
jgi:glycine dehydrogenase